MALTNQVRLIGYCGVDATVEWVNGKAICRLPIYTTHWRLSYDKEGRQKCTERHTCVFFGVNAERAGEQLLKGGQVNISGTLHYHKKKTPQGLFIYPQILVDEFMLTTTSIMTKQMYDEIFPDGKIPDEIMNNPNQKEDVLDIMQKINK